MSVWGLAFYFALGGNVFISWGLMPPRRSMRPSSAWDSLIFLALAACASLVYGLVYRFIFMPFGLESLAPLSFALCLLGAYAGSRALCTFCSWPLPVLGDTAFQATLVLYAVAMGVGGRFLSPWVMLGGGAVAAFGYIAATRFLDDIMDRLDLEPVPGPFREGPIRLISAGLMALAFHGIDASFFSVLLG